MTFSAATVKMTLISGGIREENQRLGAVRGVCHWIDQRVLPRPNDQSFAGIQIQHLCCPPHGRSHGDVISRRGSRME